GQPAGRRRLRCHLRISWPCLCYGRELAVFPAENLSSFPRSAWERNGTSKGYHAERGSQLFQRSAFLIPTLCVGMQRYQQGLPRRAWEPVIPTLRIPRSHAPRGNTTVPARTTTQSVGASYSNAPHSSFP